MALSHPRTRRQRNDEAVQSYRLTCLDVLDFKRASINLKHFQEQHSIQKHFYLTQYRFSCRCNYQSIHHRLIHRRSRGLYGDRTEKVLPNDSQLSQSSGGFILKANRTVAAPNGTLKCGAMMMIALQVFAGLTQSAYAQTAAVPATTTR